MQRYSYNVQNVQKTFLAPDGCPVCHHHSEYHIAFADYVETKTKIQACFRCGYHNCRYFFLCDYATADTDTILSVRPLKPNVGTFPDPVVKVSATFIAIFAEAEEAKALGLHQIAGPGYRKAFEFLIKDYAKTLAPEKAKEIEEKFAGAVVNEFIQDTRIQRVAKRALWVGNDESHYLRKWQDKDVTDLVNLIKLTADWIEIGQLSNEYVDDMPE